MIQPLKQFNRAYGGPPSFARYFPDSMPIAKGLYANKKMLQKDEQAEDNNKFIDSKGRIFK